MMRVLGLLAVCVCLASCASSRPPDAPKPTVVDTRGLSFEMRITGDDQFAAMYRVQRNGWLEFAGGRDVIADAVTWTTPLTEADIERLHEAIEQNDWYAHPPSGDAGLRAGEPMRTTRVSGRGPGGGLWFTVRGEHARVAPVRTVLAEVADRRLEKELSQLPQAGDRPPQ